MNISLPFRGLNVVPQTVVSVAEQIAVMYYYSGVTGSQPSGGAGNDIFHIACHPHFGGHKSVMTIG